MPTTRSILENVFGMLGIVFWSFQLLPQAIDNYKAKSTEGLSYSMFFIWTLCALGFGSYGVVEELSIPLIVQPQIFGFLSMAGIDNNVPGTVEAAGIIPILLLVLGFIPQYIDIYRDRSVVGVSMAFIAADAAGAIFSIISLCFRNEFDLLATCNYIAVLVCDLIVVLFWGYFNKMHPELARVRGGGQDLENGVTGVGSGGEEKEVESAIVTIVEPELDGNRAVEETEKEKEMNGTIVADNLQAAPVAMAPTITSQVSLSSAHSNSTVAQA
ncbi:hypothetical protein BGZ95_009076 [Linnemannia exigua]|uniref:PQ-loop-domain-containing protein n=1 Tax=Linnemannia exigua TaxID=604196 RepID=A0AAD4DF53_9FUNG|nr:hypothetical protein BGZ95_009076 [Linnemannia exigua]